MVHDDYSMIIVWGVYEPAYMGSVQSPQPKTPLDGGTLASHKVPNNGQTHESNVVTVPVKVRRCWRFDAFVKIAKQQSFVIVMLGARVLLYYHVFCFLSLAS